MVGDEALKMAAMGYGEVPNLETIVRYDEYGNDVVQMGNVLRQRFRSDYNTGKKLSRQIKLIKLDLVLQL